MDITDISRVRRFTRAVTTEIGALDTSFLGRGRPLGAARVLCAIGQDGLDVGAIRTRLSLDSGLTSRLLRALENEDLVKVGSDPDDKRKRIATLTAKGQQEVAEYDRLSDTRAQRLLSHHPNGDHLLDAMDLIASALGQHRIEFVETDPRAPEARVCLNAYYATLAKRFDTGFDPNQSLDPDATDMLPPRGVFLVAMSDGLPVGCGGLKGNGTAIGELKRLWVAPSARGLGLAGRLMDEIETHARALGVSTLRLDTNASLTEAMALYRKQGWVEIPAFNDEPYAHHWFEKHL